MNISFSNLNTKAKIKKAIWVIVILIEIICFINTGFSAADSQTQNTNSIQATPVKETKVVYPVIKGKKCGEELSLTFDDGYDRASIERVLTTMKSKDIKCTFFVIGTVLKIYPELWKRALADGHQICNHTYDHKFLSSLSNEKIESEIEGWEKVAREVLGDEYVDKMKKEFPYLRLPGGEGDRTQRILKIIEEHGYTPIGWADETCYSVLRHHKLGSEPVNPIAEEVSIHVVVNAYKGSIVLLHFNPYDTIQIEKIVKGISDKGLQIKTVSELLKNDN